MVEYPFVLKSIAFQSWSTEIATILTDVYFTYFRYNARLETSHLLFKCSSEILCCDKETSDIVTN